MDKQSRSTIEMNDPASRPAIKGMRDNMDDYDTVFVGFLSGGMSRRQSSTHFLRATT